MEEAVYFVLLGALRSWVRLEGWMDKEEGVVVLEESLTHLSLSGLHAGAMVDANGSESV